MRASECVVSNSLTDLSTDLASLLSGTRLGFWDGVGAVGVAVDDPCFAFHVSRT